MYQCSLCSGYSSSDCRPALPVGLPATCQIICPLLNHCLFGCPARCWTIVCLTTLLIAEHAISINPALYLISCVSVCVWVWYFPHLTIGCCWIGNWVISRWIQTGSMSNLHPKTNFLQFIQGDYKVCHLGAHVQSFIYISCVQPISNCSLRLCFAPIQCAMGLSPLTRIH